MVDDRQVVYLDIVFSENGHRPVRPSPSFTNVANHLQLLDVCNSLGNFCLDPGCRHGKPVVIHGERYNSDDCDFEKTHVLILLKVVSAGLLGEPASFDSYSVARLVTPRLVLD